MTNIIICILAAIIVALVGAIIILHRKFKHYRSGYDFWFDQYVDLSNIMADSDSYIEKLLVERKDMVKLPGKLIADRQIGRYISELDSIRLIIQDKEVIGWYDPNMKKEYEAPDAEFISDVVGYALEATERDKMTYKAYETLVALHGKKKVTKADLEAAIGEAVGYLGEALE